MAMFHFFRYRETAAAGCIEGLWKRFLRWTGLGAGGFLSLTALAGLRVVVAPFGQTSHVMSAI